MSKITSIIKRIGNEVRRFFFPGLCICCHCVLEYKHEQFICNVCKQKWESAKSSHASRLKGLPVVPLEIECENGIRESFAASLVSYRQNALEPDYSVQKRLIFDLKQHDYKSLVDFLACELAELIRQTLVGEKEINSFIIVSIPRNPFNLIDTANDGVKEVSREVAHILGAKYTEVFYKSLFSKEQKKLSSKQREVNARRSLKIKKNAPEKLYGRRIILIDDVVTTGSSVREAARLLYDRCRARAVYIYSIAGNADMLLRKG
ncbi:MAG: ComF family protein [Clostridia bacterium]|nr:ComF family protein [Clostridia bacterium]